MKTYPFQLLIVPTLAILIGCVGGKIDARLRELDVQLKPLVGKHKEAALLSLGPPQESFVAGSTEVWKYHIGYGTKTYYPKNYVTGEYLGSARTWERYDEYQLIIVRDTIASYKTEVQR